MTDTQLQVVIKNAGIFHAVAQCAHSQKDPRRRPHVQNVLIEKLSDDRALIVATDGAALACAPVEAEWAADAHVALLPAAEIVKATRPVANRKKWLFVRNDQCEVLDLKSNASLSFIRVKLEQTATDFPDWRRVMPRKDEMENLPAKEAYAGGFETGQLERVAKIGKLLRTAGALEWPSMVFDGAHGEDAPCRIVYGDFDAIVVLMPYRHYANATLRSVDIEWLRL